MNETWCAVPGYEFYEVSDRGQVRSLDKVARSRWGTPKPIKGRILKQSKQGRYPVVTLYRDATGKTIAVHRVVLLAFTGPCPDGQEALHFDDDPENNCLENLRWGTPNENALDCIRNGNQHQVNKTHCPRGHEYTPENTWVSAQNGHRWCRACIIEKGEARKTRPHSRDRTHCPQGHPYDSANTYLDTTGRRHCRACSRERQKEYARRRRLSPS
jgi:hypothetical protein